MLIFYIFKSVNLKSCQHDIYTLVQKHELHSLSYGLYFRDIQ